MKEMYLKVEVEDVKDIDFVDVFYRKGRYFTCPKDDAELVEIEDAEAKGAEKLHEAITVICFGNSADVKGAFDGYCTVSNIIGNFSLKEIIERVEKLKMAKQHVPAQGDIYKDKRLGFAVTVLSFDDREDTVQYVSRDYMTFEPEKCFNNRYEYTGENIDVSTLVNKIGLN